MKWKDFERMPTLFMELVPAIIVVTLTSTLVYAYVTDGKDARDRTYFRDWATNLVALYVGKSISDHAQEQAARQLRERQTNGTTSTEVTTAQEREHLRLPEVETTETTPHISRSDEKPVSRRKRPK